MNSCVTVLEVLLSDEVDDEHAEVMVKIAPSTKTFQRFLITLSAPLEFHPLQKSKKSCSPSSGRNARCMVVQVGQGE